MRFGWLTLAHSPSPEEDFVAIEQQLAQACAAEELGFDTVWLTEHNFTGESVYCDPIPFAAALAMRTSRVRIGFAVIQMALRHPIRLATQLALLDNLSKGRLDVGVGKGTVYNEYEFVGFGLRSDDARERLHEGVDLLKAAWLGAPIDHKSKHFQVKLPAVRPKPYQTPHPPIWHSAVAPASFMECGRAGVPIMTVRLPLSAMRERMKLYACGLAESGCDETTRNSLLGKAALWRHIYVAESRAQAEDELAAALTHTRHHMNTARETFNPPDFRFDRALLNPWTNPEGSDADAIRFSLETGTLYGTARDVIEQVSEIRAAGIHHLLCQMSFGYLAHDKILASMRRFGTQVIPAFV
jgi:alkanesulfonate monooxygenase SsuD/methylene tetrahydromethanopterin reductase-like flavin-dependent oxidoreductase (luciferase family)